jgi:hypothetical protein
MKINRIIAVLMLVIALPKSGFTGTVADYLILQDIGQYKFMGKGGGQGSGIVSATGHFRTDHTDVSYSGMYFNEVSEIGVNVEVSKHAGSDSDKWLLHEAERGFRDTDNMEACTDEDSMVRVLNSNKIFFYGGGVVGYRWISNNVVVNIQYTNLGGPKPEPLEVVKAYLSKFPSSISMADAEFKAKAHNEKWIRDEMDRRLWLCDKWFYQLQMKMVEDEQVYQESVKSMNVFLDYREKYYGIKVADEKNLIAGYLNNNNGTGIKAKLDEYKKWWVVNKEKGISL